MTAPPAVPESFRARLAELVSKFDRHRDQYLKASYNESQVRVDFVDPLFEALGWDVRNAAGLGPREREVVVERGETTGRPDYNFRLEGQTKFFVEAKAPHVPLDRSDVIMQVKSYAWNTRDVFVAAVSDFEEFRLYDASLKPDRKRPDTGLLFALRYGDYLTPDGLARLWELSREAVRAGSLDRLLKVTAKEKRQRVPVDQAFLADLTGWRERLAKAVYKAHPGMDAADLNSAVQVFLDRLIFIRIAEDRGVLPPRGLKEIVEAWEYSGKRRPLADDLNALFREVNDRLNGEIFKPHHSEKIARDAPLVAGIAAGLYYPACPYRFDVIDVELLGSIYERYLGKTIRVTEKRAIVEDKPEVRKAGGVYYTPKPDPHPQPLSLKGRGESAPSPSPRRGEGRGEGRQLSLLPPADLTHLRPFNWESEREGFGAIMKAGGFDAVIGNPPYLGGREWKEEGGRRYEYFVDNYAVAEYQFDIYALFWERGIRLLKRGGLIGFITPNTWLNNKGSTKLRSFILENTSAVSITDYSRVKVFPEAVVLPIITVLKRESDPSAIVEIYEPREDSVALSHRIPQRAWADDELKIFNIALREGEVELREKIEADKVPLESLAVVKFGIKLYETGKGDPPQKASDAENHIFEAARKVSAAYRRYLEGKDIQSYEINWQSRWLKYGKNLAAPRDPALFEGSRLLVRRIVGERLIGTFTDEDYVTSQLLQIVKPHEPQLAKYLLGVLNSSLIAYYFKKKYNRQDKTFPEIRVYELATLPIRPINFSDPADKARHDRMAALVERMPELHKRKAEAKSETLRAQLEREINVTDEQIDGLVYELYGLTEEEVRLVEGK
jgi:hypothetical protein